MSSNQRTLCLMFRAAGERVAIRASDVQKVTPLAHVSRLPRLPASVVGITQHRGRVVTVVDVAALLFGTDRGPKRPSSTSSEARLLILERPVRHLGLLVDAVDEIENLRLAADLPQGAVPALRVTQHRGRAVAVVDVEKLVSEITAIA